MADFIDSEAEESEEEEMELTEKDRKKLRKIRDEDEEDDDDDDGHLADELKDLINDDEEEEGSSSSDNEEKDSFSGRKRKKHTEEDELDDRLEDDDYDLIEENLGVKVERKKFKRVRIEDDDSEDEASKDQPEDRDAIANDLFEGSDEEGEPSERRNEREGMEADYDESEGEYSETDDFIVDDDGQPLSRKEKKRKTKYGDRALQEAQDIFGVDFDFDEMGQFDEDYEEEEMYEDEDEEETRRHKKSPKKKSTKKSIFEIYEPSELERGHFTDKDNEIRTADIPERFQLRNIPVTPAESIELVEEASWIYKYAFGNPSVSDQGQTSENRKNASSIAKIKEALDCIRNQHFEVPFIAFYRKECVEPDLNIQDLWKIYQWDEKWCQLKSRKGNLLQLFQKMQQYQCDQLLKNPDDPLPEGIRLISDEDMNNLKEVETMEQLRDSYHHFSLYFGNDIEAMHEAFWKKEAAEKQIEKPKKMRRVKKIKVKTVPPEEKDKDGDEDMEKEPVEGEEGSEPNKENEPRVIEDEESEYEEIEEEEEEDNEEEAKKVSEMEERMKKAVKVDNYTLCKRARLEGFASKFGLTPQQLGENLRDNYQRHDVDQFPGLPKELAAEYICTKFPTEDDVLKAARYVVAMQISREPAVRNCVREVYFERAIVDVTPTKKGVKEIDENHTCYAFKFLKNKAVKTLFGDQYLKIKVAEEEGLLTSKVHMGNGSDSRTYFDEIKQLYYKDEFSTHVQEWNDQRSSALETALTKFLYPVMEKDIRAKLYSEAKDFVLKACCHKLYNYLKVAPYSFELNAEDDEDYDTSNGIKVMSIAYLPDREVSAFCAIVSGEGEVTDYVRLPGILNRKNSWNERDRLAKEKDLENLKVLISTKKPHVIVIGAQSRDAQMIQVDLKALVTELVETEQLPNIGVELLDNELATIYSNCKKGEADFREYPELLRQAVSLARRMQDPLLEFSQICGPDEDILCLKFNKLQDVMPKDDLLNALFTEFINRTNEVGVDVNRCLNFPNTANVLQFVCGLGPRKSAALIKTLKHANTGSRLENRTQLVTACHMGPKVFINCAGFIKIDTNSLGDSTESYIEVLDGSRVHPETYEWARKMAVDALEYDDEEESNPAGALEEILENPDKLKDLDLDAFAEELERQNYGNKAITLYDIRAELNHRYKDLRVAFTPPNPEEMFNLLTKETPETFYIGKLVMASVIGFAYRKPKGDQLDQANPIRNEDTGMWQCPFCRQNDFLEVSDVWNHFDAGNCRGQAVGVRVRLDNAIGGFIQCKMISDKQVTDPTTRVKERMILHCRITKIDIERFSVELTCRSSDLADKNNEWRPHKDVFYDYDSEDTQSKLEDEQKKRQNRQTYIKRVIVHPSFHNIGFKEAEKKLESFDQGEVIVRPSSKGPDHLTATWKVAEGIYQHIDVREEGKENAFSLGQSLYINNEEFEDLDEIIARYIQPQAAFARDLLNFRYYRFTNAGTRDEMEKIVREEKLKAPSKIHYYLSASKELPGKFILSYLPRNKVGHEYITVTSDGFRYRQHIFQTIDSLVKWFKNHFRDPVPGTPTSLHGRTPYMGATPSINLANVDPQAIHRAAQNLPSSIYSALSQVASQTPHSQFGGYSYQTPYTPSQPVGTPLLTPSYHHPMTPGHSHNVTTPRFQPTTPQTNWTAPAPPNQTPGNRTPSSRSTTTSKVQAPPQAQSGTTDWKKAAEQWAKQRQKQMDGRSTPRSSGNTPRSTPRLTTGSPSPMVESTPGGDATPLIDE